MDVLFRTTKLERLCNDDRRMQRELGPELARRLRARLDDLDAARSLADFRHLSGRLHELKGDRAGQLSLDLVHPQRLILLPAHDPVPTKADGGLDWGAVTAVEILEIADTHA